MRIAFDYQAFVWQTHGGISRYYSRLVQELHALEQQVRVFAPWHRNQHLAGIPGELVEGRYLQQYPRRTTRLFLACNRLVARRRMAGWKPDVVHETYFSSAASAASGCPSVVTVYDMINELFPDEFPGSEHIRAAKQAAVDRADHVVCISENTRQDLMRICGTPASRISVVHLGFDQFAPRAASEAAGSTERPFLLYVGQRAGYKNFAGLLEAVASSDSLRTDFDVTAFGGGGFSAEERQTIARLGFADGQVVHRHGGDEVLGELYASARAFVYPSLYEGFGIPPLEAMAHQCPVVCSNTSSIPEVVGDAGEYFDPLDVDDLRQAIERVVYSQDAIAGLNQRGARRLQAFSWKDCAEQTLEIYRGLR